MTNETNRPAARPAHLTRRRWLQGMTLRRLSAFGRLRHERHRAAGPSGLGPEPGASQARPGPRVASRQAAE